MARLRRSGPGLWLWAKLPSRLWRVLRSPRVSARDKLLLIVPVLLYWVLPDLMPFVPIDDAAVTLIAAAWYVGRMERKYGPGAFD